MLPSRTLLAQSCISCVYVMGRGTLAGGAREEIVALMLSASQR